MIGFLSIEYRMVLGIIGFVLLPTLVMHLQGCDDFGDNADDSNTITISLDLDPNQPEGDVTKSATTNIMFFGLGHEFFVSNGTENEIIVDWMKFSSTIDLTATLYVTTPAAIAAAGSFDAGLTQLGTGTITSAGTTIDLNSGSGFRIKHRKNYTFVLRVDATGIADSTDTTVTLEDINASPLFSVKTVAFQSNAAGTMPYLTTSTLTFKD